MSYFRIVRMHVGGRIPLLLAMLAASVIGLSVTQRALAQGGQGVSAQAQRLITIRDRHQERVVLTTARTTRQVLASAGIVTTTYDLVRPALDEPLAEKEPVITITRARPITVIDGSRRVRLMTAEQAPTAIAQAAGLPLYEGDRAELTLSRHILIDGPGPVLTLHRAPSRLLNIDQPLPFEVKQQIDPTKPAGFRQVVQVGVQGVRRVTFELSLRQGREVARREVASAVLTPAIEQREIIGTKPEAMPYTGGGNKDQWLAASGIPRDQWGYVEWLVQKESGWNPNARNPRSGACGLAQALPCSKVGADPHNPVVSLRWMHGYVTKRYGSWAAAVAHSKRHNWY